MPGTVRKKAEERNHPAKKAQKDQARRGQKDATRKDCAVKLGEEDAYLVAHLLNNPPAPSDRLLQAAQRYRELVR